MKILTLNTWGGRAGRENLLRFFDEHQDVDAFCLQEVWSGSYAHLGEYQAGGVQMKGVEIMIHGKQDIASVLKDHAGFFRPHFMDDYGLYMLLRNSYPVTVEGEVFVHKEKGYIPEGDAGHHARNIQYITTVHQGAPLTIMNFHGLWNGKGKTDSEERIEQSLKIVDFLKSIKGEFVLCGDFNLLPDTESLKIIEHAGVQNLVKEYGIQSTRTSLYKKPEKFADYVFVSPGLTVKDFHVLPDEVSDHAPLLLEIA